MHDDQEIITEYLDELLQILVSCWKSSLLPSYSPLATFFSPFFLIFFFYQHVKEKLAVVTGNEARNELY